MERCDGYGGGVRYIIQRGVKGIRKVCQLMERCDGYGRGVKRCGKV